MNAKTSEPREIFNPHFTPSPQQMSAHRFIGNICVDARFAVLPAIRRVPQNEGLGSTVLLYLSCYCHWVHQQLVRKLQSNLRTLTKTNLSNETFWGFPACLWLIGSKATKLWLRSHLFKMVPIYKVTGLFDVIQLLKFLRSSVGFRCDACQTLNWRLRAAAERIYHNWTIPANIQQLHFISW